PRHAMHVLDICRVVVEAGARPPEADGVRVLRGLLTPEDLVDFDQRLRAFELFVGDVVGTVELRDFRIHCPECWFQLLRSRQGDDVDRSNIALSEIAYTG